MGSGWVRVRLAGAMLIVAAVGAVAVGSPALAGPGIGAYGYGYVWANNPATTVGTAYPPSLNYQYNSTGATNTVTRTDTGVYQVRFPGLAAFGTTQVSAYGGATDDRCKVSSWAAAVGAPDTLVLVRCFSWVGVPTNSMFTVSYTYASPSAAAFSAYLWSDQTSTPIGTAFTPSSRYQFNSLGYLNTVTRYNTGQYMVRLPGLAPPANTPYEVMVTAYGTPAGDPSVSCNLMGVRVDPTDFLYDVVCLNNAGAETDSRFTLTYVESGNHLLAPVATHQTATVNADCSTPTYCHLYHPYTTDPTRPITVTSLGSGNFSVRVPDLPAAGNVQVTAEGYNLRCKVNGWAPAQGVVVGCRSIDGTDERSTFQVSFVR